jgi:uncharacterized membrane protein
VTTSLLFARTPAAVRTAACFVLRWLPWFIIAAFSAAYIRLAAYNLLHFDGSWDLGIYHQGLYHLSHGRIPISTLKGMRLWGDHASFILVLLAPLYRLFPGPHILVVVQALAVTTSTWFLYRVALLRVKNRFFALALLASALSFFGIQYALDFDFHVTVLTAAGLSLVLYGLETGRFFVYWPAVGLTLLTKEDAAPILFMVGLLLAARRNVRWGVTTMILSLAYFLVVGYVLMPRWSPDHTPIAYFDLPEYGRNPLAITVGILTHPFHAISKMTDTPTKVHTLGMLNRSFGTLPLLSPATYALGAPILVSRFLSAEENRWEPMRQYNATMLPVLAYGAILGVQTIRRVSRSWPLFSRSAALTIVTLLMLWGTYETSWGDVEIPLRRLRNPEFVDVKYLPTRGIAALKLVKAIVPREAAVAASSGFLAEFAGRKYVYLFPKLPPAKKLWVVVSPEFNTWPLKKGEMEEAITRLTEDPAYETVWSEYGVWAFRKRTTEETKEKTP